MNVNKFLTCFLLIVFLLRINDSVAQNPVARGYKGIWFTLGQFSEYGDKYSGGPGTYTADHIPVAVYSPETGKTFFVYGGTTKADERHLLIMISYYDHRTKMVPRPVIVFDKTGVDDPHDNAALSIDNEGFILIFIGGRSRSRPGYIFKSKAPYSIESFEKILEGEMTYPQPWMVNDHRFLYMFTKYTRGRELYWSTSTDGKKWSEDHKLAGMGGHYQVTNMYGDKLESGYRIDILVEGKVVIEIKSVEALNDVHMAQTLTYMKLGNYKPGLLINFNVSLLKDGIRRIANKI